MAIHFIPNGTDGGYLSYADNANFRPSGGTMSWRYLIYLDNAFTSNGIIQKTPHDASGNQNQYRISAQGGGTFHVQVGVGSSEWAVYYTWGTASVSTGAWYDCVVTWDKEGGTGLRAKYYVNGSLYTTGQYTAWSGDTNGNLYASGTQPLLLGGGNSSEYPGQHTLDGRLAEVSIWDVVLDSTEISGLYNDGTFKRATTLTAHTSDLMFYAPLTNLANDNDTITSTSPTQGNSGYLEDATHPTMYEAPASTFVPRIILIS